MSDFDRAVPVDRAALASHYKEVEAFQIARAKSVQRLSKIMTIVTALALVGNLAQAWTIAVMMPLTRIVPVYLWVRPDGTVDSSISLSQLPGTSNQAVIDATLWEYVRLREGFSYDTARYGYDIVSQFSVPNVRNQYQRFFNYPNPSSPQVTIGKKGTINITHISTSDLEPGVQQIRFMRIVQLDGRQPVTTTWTATISYTIVLTLPAGMRLSNPGGLLVTSYQSSEDSP